MLHNPDSKYRSFAPVGLVDRIWPNRVIHCLLDSAWISLASNIGSGFE